MKNLPVRVVYVVSLTTLMILAISRSLNDSIRTPYAGWTLDRNFTVDTLVPQSPAANAGVELGDMVRSIEGIPINNREKVVPLGRSLKIGDALSYEVTRGGEVKTVLIVYDQPPTAEKITSIVRTLSTGVPLVIGVLAGLLGENFIMTLFSVICYLAVLLGIDPPRPDELSFSVIVWILYMGAILATPALICHFLLLVPEPRKWTSRVRHWQLLFYQPVLITFIFSVVVFLSAVKQHSTITTIMTILIAIDVLFWVSYLLIGVISFLLWFGKNPVQTENLKVIRNAMIGIGLTFLPSFILYLMHSFAGRQIIDYGISDFFISFIPVVIFYFLRNYQATVAHEIS